MSFWQSHLGGIIIGSGVAGIFTLLAQVFAYSRQKNQFAHDLQVRQQQFAHEREQEIRGRRTAALAELLVLLEDQATSLEKLWAFIGSAHPQSYPHLKDAAVVAWKVLLERNYRKRLWPINGPITKFINEYAARTANLLVFLRQHKDVEALWESEGSALSVDSRAAANREFQAVTAALGSAMKEIVDLTSELNDIEVKKDT